MRLASSAGFSLLVYAGLLGGCASQAPWSPTVDTYGNSRAQYLSRDMEECRALARSASGSTGGQAAHGAGVGALAGAAGGTVIGALFGRPGRGAAIGAISGAAGGGALQAGRTEERFKQAFSNCLRERGHNVIG